MSTVCVPYVWLLMHLYHSLTAPLTHTCAPSPSSQSVDTETGKLKDLSAEAEAAAEPEAAA